MPQKRGRAGEPPKCVLGAADNRLREIHHHWHTCLDQYDDPASFRIALNACIQSARNVTFAIQKQKSFLAQYLQVYEGWRTAAGSDSILKWVVSSRNRIVKENYLDTDSILRTTLSVGYDDAAVLVMESFQPQGAVVTLAKEDVTTVRRYTFPARMSKKAVVRALGLKLPASILDESTIVLERRWADQALPKFELLTALAYAYSAYADLVRSLHDAAGIHHDHRMTSSDHNSAVNTSAPEFVHPSCMVTTREYRTEELNLSDGSFAGRIGTFRIDRTQEGDEEARTTFGDVPVFPKDAKTPMDYMPAMMQSAQSIVKAKMQHAFFVWFFVGAEIQGFHLAARDRGLR